MPFLALPVLGAVQSWLHHRLCCHSAVAFLMPPSQLQLHLHCCPQNWSLIVSSSSCILCSRLCAVLCCAHSSCITKRHALSWRRCIMCTWVPSVSTELKADNHVLVSAADAHDQTASWQPTKVPACRCTCMSESLGVSPQMPSLCTAVWRWQLCTVIGLEECQGSIHFTFHGQPMVANVHSPSR